MTTTARMPDAATRRLPAISLRHLTIITLTVVLAMHVSTTSARADVGLGTADDFAILAGQSVTNTGPTTITGDIGIHPGAAGAGLSNVTGAGSITHNGTTHDGDGVAQDAKADLVTAYDDAAGRAVTNTIAPQLDGADLGPGVYESTASGAFELSVGGTLTLTGDANDVWIFQSSSTLVFNSNSEVVLSGGANACNVFWQVGSSATLDSGTDIVGTIMALQDISLVSNAELEGRALARNGSVTMDSNVISNAACVTSSSTSSTSSSDAVRLVKFWYDAAGTRVDAPAGDWTVTLGSAVVRSGQASAWAALSGANYRVSEDDTPAGWDETDCSTVTLPDIGTDYLDATGTGDHRFPSGVSEGAHAVCNQTDVVLPAGASPFADVQTPTRIDTGAGGASPLAVPTGVLLLLAVAVMGTAVTPLRRTRRSG